MFVHPAPEHLYRYFPPLWKPVGPVTVRITVVIIVVVLGTHGYPTGILASALAVAEAATGVALLRLPGRAE